MVFPPAAIPAAVYEPIIETADVVRDTPDRVTRRWVKATTAGNDLQALFLQESSRLVEIELPHLEAMMNISISAVEEEGTRLGAI